MRLLLTADPVALANFTRQIRAEQAAFRKEKSTFYNYDFESDKPLAATSESLLKKGVKKLRFEWKPMAKSETKDPETPEKPEGKSVSEVPSERDDEDASTICLGDPVRSEGEGEKATRKKRACTIHQAEAQSPKRHKGN